MNIEKRFLTINPYSRPGTKIGVIKGPVFHWVANPGSTAINNRNYFENLKDTKARYASSHYIIGLEGEIIQCIPENEIAYHATGANTNFIGIECCHPDASGKFTKETLNSMIMLGGDILKRYGVSKILRHHDVTGKNCPKYFVDNPSEWVNFREDVKNMAAGMYPVDMILGAIANKTEYTGGLDRGYWKNVLEGKKQVESQYLHILLTRILGIAPASDVSFIIEGMQHLTSLNPPEYWKNVLEGKQKVKTEYLRVLLGRLVV